MQFIKLVECIIEFEFDKNGILDDVAQAEA